MYLLQLNKNISCYNFLPSVPLKANAHSSNRLVSLNVSDELKSQEDDKLAEDVEKALFLESDKSKRMSILTTLPRTWSVRKMQKKLNISMWTALKAKKLREKSGYASTPPKKRAANFHKHTLTK